MEKVFCRDCKHKDVSTEIKLIFNEKVQKTFITCPFEEVDGNVVGCFNKQLEIDWGGFTTFCKNNKLL